MKSTDGGIHWDKLQSDLEGKIYFNNHDVGFLIGRLLNPGDCFYRTSDGGKSWNILKFKYPLSDVSFQDQNKGFACGAYVSCWHTGCRSFGDLFSTKDGGKTWKSILDVKGWTFRRCHFINENVGFLLHGGGFYKTTDSGDSWASVFPSDDDSTGFQYACNDIDFKNEQVGWIVGSVDWADSSGDAILGTVDGGKNWDLVWTCQSTYDSRFMLNSVHTTGTEAWTVGNHGMIVFKEAEFYAKKTGKLKRSG